jgi:hypothetical protein
VLPRAFEDVQQLLTNPKRAFRKSHRIPLIQLDELLDGDGFRLSPVDLRCVVNFIGEALPGQNEVIRLKAFPSCSSVHFEHSVKCSGSIESKKTLADPLEPFRFLPFLGYG